jgi:hypothetical protein
MKQGRQEAEFQEAEMSRRMAYLQSTSTSFIYKSRLKGMHAVYYADAPATQRIHIQNASAHSARTMRICSEHFENTSSE